MLMDNKSLEFISFSQYGGRSQVPTIGEDFNLLESLQENTALKAISLQQQDLFATNPGAAPPARVVPTDDESKQMASLLKKKYALDSLSDIDFLIRTEIGRHLAIEWSRAWVSYSRRSLSVERR
jgi:hypothetical protein